MEKQSTEIRQEQIKQAVLDIIYTEGLKNLSTRKLARKIGVSDGAIFRHFASKGDIILAIVNDVQHDFIGTLRHIANSPDSPGERLHRYICQTVNYLTQNKGITMLMFSEASHNNDAKLKATLLQIFNMQKSLVSKIILDGIALGQWNANTPVESLASLYMGIPVSLNIELILNNGEIHIDNYCTKMMSLMLKVLEK